MASQLGSNDAGSSGRGILSSEQLGSSDLRSKRLLGTGLASVVYETEVHGQKFARKDFVGVPSGIFEKEAAVLVRLEDHINVVKTLGWTVNKMSCSLVLEYVDDGLVDQLQKRKQFLKPAPKASLEAGTSSGNQSDRTRTSPPFELPEAVDIMEQIARGMEHLHDQGILHGDLKTKNILVTRGDQNSVSVKVADFGLVRTKRKSTSFASRQARKLDMARWKAPEILEVSLAEDNDETTSESDSEISDEECADSSGGTKRRVLDGNEDADVYSFAVTCCQILTGEDPYPNRNWRGLMASIVAGELRPNLPAACPPRLRDLLESCWSSASHRCGGQAAFSGSRPTFPYIRWTLNRHRRDILLLPYPVNDSLTSVFGSVFESVFGSVFESVNRSIELLMEDGWFQSSIDDNAWFHDLRKGLTEIRFDAEKFERFERVSELCRWDLEYRKRVKDWLTRLQFTVGEVREYNVSVINKRSGRDSPVLIFLLTELSKQLQGSKELASVAVSFYSSLQEQPLFLSTELPSHPMTVFISLSRTQHIHTIIPRLFHNLVSHNLETSIVESSGNSVIIKVNGFPPTANFGPRDVLNIVMEMDSRAEILESFGSEHTHGSSDAGTVFVLEPRQRLKAAPNMFPRWTQ